MYKVLQQTIGELIQPESLFEISDVEIAGLKYKAWKNAPTSLRDVWLQSSVRGDDDYLVYENERWTYAEAHDQVARIGHWLVNNDIKPHDHVAISMRNYPEWLLAFWAIVSVGAVPVGMNSWWVAEEMRYALKDSNAKLLICDRERLEHFGELRNDFLDLSVVAVRVDELPEWAQAWSKVLESPAELPEVHILPDDDASIFYTSGTTGFPKGARLTHRSCTNNILSMVFGGFAFKTAEAKLAGEPLPELFPENPEPLASIVTTPLFHVTANNCVAQVMTMFGGKLVFMYKWDVDEAVRLLGSEQITSFSGVPSMSREVISHPEFLAHASPKLETLGGGGAPVHPDIIEKISSSGHTVQAAQGYGLTETSGMVAASRGPFQQSKPTSAGVVSPIFDVKCINDSGNELDVGQAGEVCLRGVQIIKGYLNLKDATSEAIVDGWFHTGDIGYIDEDGFIHLVDRAKDMVLRGGENVYCAETEAAIFKVEGVKECAVFAVPDKNLGEEVGAAIYVDSDLAVTTEQIREFCLTKIAAFKVPRYIWVMDSPLPRNASGKFLKKELQKTLSTEYAE